MATKIFGTAIPSALGFVYIERIILPGLVPALFKPSTIMGLSRAVGVPIIATTIAAFWLTIYGFSVGDARKKYMEKAKKDGEKDVETRYALPNLVSLFVYW